MATTTAPRSFSPEDAARLFAVLHDFFQVVVHTLLFYRRLYPERAFLSTTAFGVPVHQNRHPQVCAWVRDAVDQVMIRVADGVVKTVALVVHAPWKVKKTSTGMAAGAVLERWVFDVQYLPSWTGGGAAALKKWQRAEATLDVAYASNSFTAEKADCDNEPIHWTNLHHQLRAVVQRLSHASAQLGPLPPDCTFTLAVELKEGDDDDDGGLGTATAGMSPDWVHAAGPGQPTGFRDKGKGKAPVAAAATTSTESTRTASPTTTTAIRSVDATPLFLECWVEESSTAKEGWLSAAETEAQGKDVNTMNV